MKVLTFSSSLKKISQLARISFKWQEEDEIKEVKRHKVVVVGCGKKDEFNNRKFILLSRKIIYLAKANHLRKVLINFLEIPFREAEFDFETGIETMIVNMELANFEFIRYKSKPREGWNFVEEVRIENFNNKYKDALYRAQIIAQGVNMSRSLANTPGGEMTPALLAKEAKEAVKGLPLKFKVLTKKEMRRLGMGAILGVSKGSIEEPRFIILEYLPQKNERPVVLIGKGVTFDTGGLNLKPTEGILDMHLDMSGGAAVIYTISTLAKLGIKRNIVGLVPAVENMPSGSSYRPGDILKSLAGKTIEVLNTDAEGRLILADAISYAQRYKPSLVIDVATLTGAAIVALGQRAAAVFSRDAKLIKQLMDIGEKCGEYFWPLPLWDEYREEIKGTFADIANVQKSKYGGAIIAAVFLYQFARELNCPWLHIDIAPRMTSIEGEYLAKGSVGCPIYSLVKFLEKTR